MVVLEGVAEGRFAITALLILAVIVTVMATGGGERALASGMEASLGRNRVAGSFTTARPAGDARKRYLVDLEHMIDIT
jgi:hypothetical protein